ncbi:MAG TPA: hypothetical protein VN701_00515, partial [Candidatus Paceibacterota bacterium]|nr:hypothetical protein [Candidatus Paceibacterota bacterium]
MYQGSSPRSNNSRPQGSGFTRRSKGGRPPFRKTPSGGGSTDGSYYASKGGSRPSFTSAHGSSAPARPAF